MKSVAVYEENKESLKFLQDFFNGHQLYSAEFFDNVRALKSYLGNNSPYALVLGMSCRLGSLSPSKVGCPVIGIITDNAVRGINNAIKSDIESYLLAPFYREDLEYKLLLFSKRLEHFSKIYQEKKDIEAVSELTCILSSTLDPQEVLYLIVKKLSDLVPVSRCSILSIRTSRDRTMHVISTFEDPKITHLKLNLKKYPEIQRAIHTKQPVIVANAAKDPLMAKVKDIIDRVGVKSIIVVPILFRSEVIGTLFLRTSRRKHIFSDREVKLCKAVAGAAANALNNAFLFDEIKSERAELERLAITDFLTGIYNIRYLYHRLEDEFSRADRYEAPLSCIMLDIDHFKLVNDNYGHRTGDMILREFATVINKHIRKSDVFARYGGEEFIMILPQTNMQGAVIEAGRLTKIIKEHKFKGLKRSTKITVSVGISTYPHKDISTQDDLIKTADDALLRAKETGRDKIVIY